MSNASAIDLAFGEKLDTFRKHIQYEKGNTLETLNRKKRLLQKIERLIEDPISGFLNQAKPIGPEIKSLISSQGAGDELMLSKIQWYLYILETFKKGDTLISLLEYIKRDIEVKNEVKKKNVEKAKAWLKDRNNAEKLPKVLEPEQTPIPNPAPTAEQIAAITALDDTIWDIPDFLSSNFAVKRNLESIKISCTGLLINTKDIESVINNYIRLILAINNVFDYVPLTSYLTNVKPKTRCLFDQEVRQNNGYCKTDKFLSEKAALSTFLVKILVRIFEVAKISNPELLLDKDPYIKSLYKAIELFCHTFGFEHADSISVYTNMLIIKLNKCFPTPVIYERCTGSGGYGCGRMILQLVPEPEPASDKRKIVLISQNNGGFSMERNGSVNIDSIRASLTGPPIKNVGGSKKNKRLRRRTMKRNM
jgi:hypothetical protein